MGIFSWFAARFAATRNPEEPGWVARSVFPPPGPDNPRPDEIKRAAPRMSRRWKRKSGPISARTHRVTLKTICKRPRLMGSAGR
jgi:hypothetical protein